MLQLGVRHSLRLPGPGRETPACAAGQGCRCWGAVCIFEGPMVFQPPLLCHISWLACSCLPHSITLRSTVAARPPQPAHESACMCAIFLPQQLELVDFNAAPFNLRPLAGALAPGATRLALGLCAPDVRPGWPDGCSFRPGCCFSSGDCAPLSGLQAGGNPGCKHPCPADLQGLDEQRYIQQLHRLSSLRSLRLAFVVTGSTPVNTIPHTLFNLTRLELYDHNGGVARHGLRGLERLPQLRHLSLAHTCILIGWPKGISSLTALTFLEVMDYVSLCPEEEQPGSPDLSLLTNLQHLHFGSTGDALIYTPHLRPLGSSLRCLSVSGCCGAARLFDAIPHLSRLTMLCLSKLRPKNAAPPELDLRHIPGLQRFYVQRPSTVLAPPGAQQGGTCCSAGAQSAER